MILDFITQLLPQITFQGNYRELIVIKQGRKRQQICHMRERERAKEKERERGGKRERGKKREKEKIESEILAFKKV